ncbi:YheC/YheD family protein [Clostridium cellulovorans]|uniref:RimK domain protein ATP-grasp n=1 Tax=Clostridium cellulovorans (strain ATCC 35296 / DSM 3052 / OCM 3 / 743B) TaxID=573061 RepID=D9SRF0_CLOC7|nr:YheC/YheD family protein [Clostridium cellulovorans]ADL52379.1 RimK domain protein ATP-grasp [Clostridium cellulovorans 743B]
MILGIYFNNYNFNRLSKGILSWKMNFLAEAAFREAVQLLVFSPLSLDWHSQNIRGLTFNKENKSWEKIICTFPNVIYDRATFLTNEKEVGKFVRQRLKEEYRIPFINSKAYFNKLETHQVLSKNLEVTNHLPETSRYQHPFQIVDFIHKYGSVYIKASGGSRGRNIYKVQEFSHNLYILSYQIKGKKFSDNLSVQEIHSFLEANKFIGKNIIIQQGIDIAQLNDCPFDIRVLAQKKDIDTWEVVDKSLRIAAQGSVVTNISSGGKVGKFTEVIPSLFSNSHLITNDVDKLVIAVCRQLEQKYGSLGELGIDIAIDKAGNVWLIEVNGKPAKVCVYHSGDLALIEKACTNIIRYSKELFKLRKLAKDS